MLVQVHDVLKFYTLPPLLTLFNIISRIPNRKTNSILKNARCLLFLTFKKYFVIFWHTKIVNKNSYIYIDTLARNSTEKISW